MKATIEERRNKAKIDCFTFQEFYDFFSKFYSMNINYDNTIFEKKTYTLHNSDITIELKSHGSTKLVSDINMHTWAGGWSSEQKGIRLEYINRYDYDELNYWYIVDYHNSVFTKIDGDYLFEIMIDFIIKNEEGCYELPLPLKRELTLNKLLL